MIDELLDGSLTDEEYALALEAEYRGRQAQFDTNGVRAGPVPHVEYQRDPIGWAVAKLGIAEHTIRWSMNAGYPSHEWDGDVDPLVQMADALVAWRDVGAESATGTGKSFWVAVLLLWFLACWEDALVFTFAPKEDQLKKYIWKEIGRLWPRFVAWFPMAELTSLTIRMRGGHDETWAATGFPVGITAGETVSAKASGMHAEHMLLIYEETQGQDPAVLEAGENTCTAPHNLRVYIGNPNHQLDTLHKACMSPGVMHVRMSAYDHPNVVTGRQIVPGACSRESIARRLAKYGKDSPVFKSRIHGFSPEEASDALIRKKWLDAARARYEQRERDGTIPSVITGKGVDVANSEHGDRGAICDFADNVMVRLDAFPCPDCNALGRRVSMEIDAAGLEPRRCGVDVTGVGSGTYNELRRLRKITQSLHFGSKAMSMVEKAPDGQTVEWAPDVNLFASKGGLRHQMFWQAREDLRQNVIDVPYDEELWEELTAHTFVEDPKVVVEPKDEVKARLGRSPDKADAFVMANWVRKRAVEPPKKELREGQSAGYDYAHRRPAAKASAEDEMQRIMSGQHSRYSVPARRGR